MALVPNPCPRGYGISRDDCVSRLTQTIFSGFRKPYSDRMATIGGTDAARRAGARLARTATSTAIAEPTT